MKDASLSVRLLPLTVTALRVLAKANGFTVSQMARYLILTGLECVRTSGADIRDFRHAVLRTEAHEAARQMNQDQQTGEDSLPDDGEKF